MTRQVREQIRTLAGGRRIDQDQWLDNLSIDEDGRWNTPEGWLTPQDRKAGTNAVPWFGTFPPSWLDGWITRWGGNGDASRVEGQGRAILGKLSEMLVEGCQTIWREVMALWRQQLLCDTGQEHQGRSRLANPTAREEELDLNMLDQRDHDLLASHLRPLYDRAQMELTLNKSALLKQRRLTAAQRRVLRWRDW